MTQARERKPVKMDPDVKAMLVELSMTTGHSQQYHLALAVTQYRERWIEIYRERAKEDSIRHRRMVKLPS